MSKSSVAINHAACTDHSRWEKGRVPAQLRNQGGRAKRFGMAILAICGHSKPYRSTSAFPRRAKLRVGWRAFSKMVSATWPEHYQFVTGAFEATGLMNFKTPIRELAPLANLALRCRDLPAHPICGVSSGASFSGSLSRRSVEKVMPR